MAETKPKTNTSLRTPKPKKLGLSVPPALRLPHEDLIMAESTEENKDVLSLVRGPEEGAPTQTSHTTIPGEPAMTSLPRHTTQPRHSLDSIDRANLEEKDRDESAWARSAGATTTGQTSHTTQTGLSGTSTQPSQTAPTTEPRQTQPQTEAAQPAREESRYDQARETSHTRLPTQTTPPSLPGHTTQREMPVAPVRDFMKVANSIGRQAVPAGFFTGKSKQLYDCLYSLTRGAIVPSRAVRISRPKLMKKAHIGSRVTFDANISRLLSVGLITVKQIPGEHEGNEYTIYLPEEVDSQLLSQATQTSPSSHTGWTGYAQYLGSPDSLEPSQTSPTLTYDISTSYGVPKTRLNTSETNDDEVFRDLLSAIKTAIVKIKGSPVVFSAAEQGRWGEVGEILVDELLDAAERAQVVSSVPSFFAEHLRRRFARRVNEPSVRSSNSLESENGSVAKPAERQPTVLTPEQILQSAEWLSELLLKDGYTVNAITEQFSAGFSSENWRIVLEKAVSLVQNRQQS
jgi:hypothetical protein